MQEQNPRPMPKRKYRLIDDFFFRFVIQYDLSIVKEIIEAFLGEGWQEGKVISQAEYVLADKRIVTDASIEKEGEIANLEMQLYEPKPNLVRYFHDRQLVVYAVIKDRERGIRSLFTLVFTDKDEFTKGKPMLMYGAKTDHGPNWPDKIMYVINVTKKQSTEKQNDICNDLSVTDLHQMRNKAIINAMKTAARNMEGDVFMNASINYEEELRKEMKANLCDKLLQCIEEHSKDGMITTKEVGKVIDEFRK